MSKRRLPPRNKKGRFVKRGSVRRRRTRAYAGYRKHGRVRRVRVARHPVLVNPRRRRRTRARRYAYVSNPRRRYRARRNPSFGGFGSIFSAPTLKQVGFAAIGLAGTPLVHGFVNRYLPVSLSSNRFAGYAIKAASAWGLSWGVGKVAGRDAGRAVLIGGLAYTALTLVTDFFPTLIGGGAPSVGRYLNSQPLLAEYPMRGLGGPITAGVPSRLDPASRF